MRRSHPRKGETMKLFLLYMLHDYRIFRMTGSGRAHAATQAIHCAIRDSMT